MSQSKLFEGYKLAIAASNTSRVPLDRKELQAKTERWERKHLFESYKRSIARTNSGR